MRTPRARRAVMAALVLAVGLAAGVTLLRGGERKPVDDAATFQPMRIGAGGWVTGVSVSNDGATRLVRTDTYGAYYWNAAANEWTLAVTATSLPATEVKPNQGQGVLAVAVAPTDSRRAYMAYNDGVFRSDDGARSWAKVLTGVPTDPNDRWRYWGSRLDVDPANPDVVYYGTQTQGLMYSRDAGTTWARVAPGAVAAPAQAPGVNAVVVDAYSGTVDGRSAVVYAAVYGTGIYRSGDGGTSWSLISTPSVVVGRNLRVMPNRDLVATTHPSVDNIDYASGDVHRWRSGAWTNIEPGGDRRWHSLAVDAAQPGRLALMGDGGYLFVSTDNGDTWTELWQRSLDSAADVPWLAWALDYGAPTRWMSIGEIKFDPVVRGRVWLTEGVGVWYADVVAGSAVRWVSQSRGIEQLVPTDVISPPGAVPVVSAWDRPILRSADPNTYPATYGPSKDFSGGWDLDWSLTDPQFLAASVASPVWPHDPSQSGYSTDGGVSWTPFASLPGASTNAATTFGFGNLAVGTPDNIVWAPSYAHRPAYTKDRGRTWNDVTLPGVSDYSPVNNTPMYMSRRIVAADRVTPGTFYLFMLGTGVFRTTDGGDTWVRTSDNAPFVGGFYDYHVTLTAVPGQAGHLFVTPGQLDGVTTVPLRRSTDGGTTWTDVANVTGVSAVGFGKGFAGQAYPSTIYIAGYVNGAYGLYRSTDDAASWTRLGDYPGGKIGHLRTIEGDKNIAGRFYLSIHGGGWMTGDSGSVVTSTTTTSTTPPPTITSTTRPPTTTSTISPPTTKPQTVTTTTTTSVKRNWFRKLLGR